MSRNKTTGNLIDVIENEQMKDDIPAFRPGDTVTVEVRVREGARERIQTFEGVVIGKRNRGLNSAFTVRKTDNSSTLASTARTTIFNALTGYCYSPISNDRLTGLPATHQPVSGTSETKCSVLSFTQK